jgi:hypothetical protein
MGKSVFGRLRVLFRSRVFAIPNRGENAFLLTQAGKLGASVETCMLQ